jgi:two-component sensor histidine kinase
MGHAKRGGTNRALRFALVALMVLIGLLAGGLVGVQYRATRDAAEVQAFRNAHVVATQFGWIFQASDQALQRIQDAVRGSASGLTQLADINTAVKDLPDGLQHSLYDRAGRLVLSSQRDRHVIDVSDRPYFQRLQAGELLVIQPMVIERLSGRQVFIIARRMESEAGPDGKAEFLGVASIAIPVDYLDELGKVMSLGNGATLSLVGLDGWMIARSPPIAPVNLIGTPSYAQLRSAPNGTYAATSPADGHRRIVGFWRMGEWPIIAVAGVEEGSVMDHFWATTRTEMMILIPILLGVGVMIVGLFRLMVIDERRARALAEAQQRSDFLLKEIHHRVKNNLQAVMSLIRLQRLPADVTEALLGRISAMVEVHREIFSGETQDRIKAAPYLRRLVGNIARGYDDRIAIDLHMEDIDLSGDLAMQVGLLTNELLTNAFKHAFPGGRPGRIEVTLARHDPDRLRLTIRDNGAGADPETQHSSMGSKLIDAFVGQMRGEITVESSTGYCTTITFPAQTDSPEK